MNPHGHVLKICKHLRLDSECRRPSQPSNATIAHHARLPTRADRSLTGPGVSTATHQRPCITSRRKRQHTHTTVYQPESCLLPEPEHSSTAAQKISAPNPAARHHYMAQRSAVKHRHNKPDAQKEIQKWVPHRTP